MFGEALNCVLTRNPRHQMTPYVGRLRIFPQIELKLSWHPICSRLGGRIELGSAVEQNRRFDMLKKMIVVLSMMIGGWLLYSNQLTTVAAQDALAAFKNNQCVICHSKLMSPYSVTSRYAQWHISLHKEKAVGCEKCHGGDATSKEAKQAHLGVQLANNVQSKLHPKNLAQTCHTCHREISNSFVESKHSQNLQAAGLGPSCNTCHAHMASEVIYTPEQTAKLCASCHDSSNALMPKRPEIPGKAEEAMQAIGRANMVTLWAERLVDEAKNRKLEVADFEREMKVTRSMLAEAKIAWHAFNLEAVRKKADAAFETGTKLKDALRTKLYPNQ